MNIVGSESSLIASAFCGADLYDPSLHCTLHLERLKFSLVFFSKTSELTQVSFVTATLPAIPNKSSTKDNLFTVTPSIQKSEVKIYRKNGAIRMSDGRFDILLPLLLPHPPPSELHCAGHVLERVAGDLGDN